MQSHPKQQRTQRRHASHNGWNGSGNQVLRRPKLLEIETGQFGDIRNGSSKLVEGHSIGLERQRNEHKGGSDETVLLDIQDFETRKSRECLGRNRTRQSIVEQVQRLQRGNGLDFVWKASAQVVSS